MCLEPATRRASIFTGNNGTQPRFHSDRRALRMRTPRLRASQAARAVAAQTTVAAIKTSQSEELAIYFQAISAKAASPKVPRAAPAASTAATFLAALLPATPARSFFSLACFSMREALAGKIAGKARNSPPTVGPNL